MALNLINVATISATTTYNAPAVTTATTLLTNAASSGHIYKVNSITASNVTAVSTTVSVSVNSAAAGGGTAYRIVYQITVPGNSMLLVLDKNSFIYLMENQSIVVTSGTASAIEYIVSYEDMS
jgi:hypothetical protein